MQILEDEDTRQMYLEGKQFSAAVEAKLASWLVDRLTQMIESNYPPEEVRQVAKERIRYCTDWPICHSTKVARS